MKLREGRKLSNAELLERRKQAVMLHKKGELHVEIARLLGVHRNTINAWIKLWKNEGAKALKPKRRGISLGTGRKLTKEQEKYIRKQITDKFPDQLKLNFALWTREAVAQLINDTLKIKLPVRTVGDYLKRWGMTPQKPVKRAYERSEPAVQKWLKEEYPALKAKAKKLGAEIQWADETGLQNGENTVESVKKRT